MYPKVAGLRVKPPATAPIAIKPEKNLLRDLVSLSICMPISIVVIFIQLFKFLNLFFCFGLINVIKVKYTHIYY